MTDPLEPIFVPLAVALAQPRQASKVGGRTVKIYALYDEDDGLVRYVGKTSKSLPRRLREHLEHPTNPAMREWLAVANVKAAVLEHVMAKEWEAAERGWIYWFRERGQLLNIDPGGRHRDDTGSPRGVFVGAYLPPGASRTRAMHKLLSGAKSRHDSPDDSRVAMRPIDFAGHSTRKGPVAGQRGTALRRREPVGRQIAPHVYVRSRRGAASSTGQAHCDVAPK